MAVFVIKRNIIKPKERMLAIVIGFTLTLNITTLAQSNHTTQARHKGWTYEQSKSSVRTRVSSEQAMVCSKTSSY